MTSIGTQVTLSNPSSFRFANATPSSPHVTYLTPSDEEVKGNRASWTANGTRPSYTSAWDLQSQTSMPRASTAGMSNGLYSLANVSDASMSGEPEFYTPPETRRVSMESASDRRPDYTGVGDTTDASEEMDGLNELQYPEVYTQRPSERRHYTTNRLSREDIVRSLTEQDFRKHEIQLREQQERYGPLRRIPSDVSLNSVTTTEARDHYTQAHSTHSMVASEHRTQTYDGRTDQIPNIRKHPGRFKEATNWDSSPIHTVPERYTGEAISQMDKGTTAPAGVSHPTKSWLPQSKVRLGSIFSGKGSDPAPSRRGTKPASGFLSRISSRMGLGGEWFSRTSTSPATAPPITEMCEKPRSRWSQFTSGIKRGQPNRIAKPQTDLVQTEPSVPSQKVRSVWQNYKQWRSDGVDQTGQNEKSQTGKSPFSSFRPSNWLPSAFRPTRPAKDTTKENTASKVREVEKTDKQPQWISSPGEARRNGWHEPTRVTLPAPAITVTRDFEVQDDSSPVTFDHSQMTLPNPAGGRSEQWQLGDHLSKASSHNRSDFSGRRGIFRRRGNVDSERTSLAESHPNYERFTKGLKSVFSKRTNDDQTSMTRREEPKSSWFGRNHWQNTVGSRVTDTGGPSLASRWTNKLRRRKSTTAPRPDLVSQYSNHPLYGSVATDGISQPTVADISKWESANPIHRDEASRLTKQATSKWRNRRSRKAQPQPDQEKLDNRIARAVATADLASAYPIGSQRWETEQAKMQQRTWNDALERKYNEDWNTAKQNSILDQGPRIRYA